MSLHNTDGTLASSYRYSAFGEKEESQGIDIPWHYASKRYDPESGLIFFGRRYYDPLIGRWLTPDPSGYEDGTNLYTYLHNNPLLSHDNYGLYTEPSNYAYLGDDACDAWILDNSLQREQPSQTFETSHNENFSLYNSQRDGYQMKSCAEILDMHHSFLNKEEKEQEEEKGFIDGLLQGLAHPIDSTLNLCKTACTPSEYDRVSWTNTAGNVLGIGVTAMPIFQICKTFAGASFAGVQVVSEVIKFSSKSIYTRSERNIIAKQIASGHAFKKHAAEFGFKRESQMAVHVRKVLSKPDKIRYLERNRIAFWHEKTKSIVIRDSRHKDWGTTFIPDQGFYYFMEVLK